VAGCLKAARRLQAAVLVGVPCPSCAQLDGWSSDRQRTKSLRQPNLNDVTELFSGEPEERKNLSSRLRIIACLKARQNGSLFWYM